MFAIFLGIIVSYIGYRLYLSSIHSIDRTHIQLAHLSLENANFSALESLNIARNAIDQPKIDCSKNEFYLDSSAGNKVRKHLQNKNRSQFFQISQCDPKFYKRVDIIRNFDIANISPKSPQNCVRIQTTATINKCEGSKVIIDVSSRYLNMKNKLYSGLSKSNRASISIKNDGIDDLIPLIDPKEKDPPTGPIACKSALFQTCMSVSIDTFGAPVEIDWPCNTEQKFFNGEFEFDNILLQLKKNNRVKDQNCVELDFKAVVTQPSEGPTVCGPQINRIEKQNLGRLQDHLKDKFKNIENLSFSQLCSLNLSLPQNDRAVLDFRPQGANNCTYDKNATNTTRAYDISDYTTDAINPKKRQKRFRFSNLESFPKDIILTFEDSEGKAAGSSDTRGWDDFVMAIPKEIDGMKIGIKGSSTHSCARLK